MFMDVSEFIASNPAQPHCGVAVSDVDGDGRFEFVVAGFGGPNRVLRWMGGQLLDAAPPLVADPGTHTVAVAGGDIDGDGREELYAINVDPDSGPKRCTDRIFKSHLDGRWEDLFITAKNGSLPNHSTGQCVGAIDRRGIGRYGFFVANNDRPMRFYELGASGTLVDLASPLGLSIVASGRGVLTLPIFSEYPDILCANETGSNLVFRNKGDGTFAECAEMQALNDSEEHGWSIVAAHANNCGELDLCFGNRESPNRLMMRQPGGVWKDRATAGFAFPLPEGTAVVADFDNDGCDEVFFNNFGEPNRLFRIVTNGGSRPAEMVMIDPGDALDPHGFGTGAAVCDIDGDGTLELLIARGDGERESQPLSIYKARAASPNNWLRIRPLTRFGAPARGAVVRAVRSGRVWVKGVCGGSGYRCQMEPVSHFGLGPNGNIDSFQVTWPDGAALLLTNPGTNRTITVQYPGG